MDRDARRKGFTGSAMVTQDLTNPIDSTVRRGEAPKAHLSVVVIGRNEGPRLERCLRSIQTMAYPAALVEVIYVDSHSTDRSVECAGALGARVVHVGKGRPTAAKGRNAGWRAASASFVLFLDGDTVLDPQFVDAAFAALRDRAVGVVFGNRREVNPGDSIYNRVLDLDWRVPIGAVPFCGGDALFKKSVLEQVGGFDETLIAGEEPELCRRIRAEGYIVAHIDTPMTLHDLAMTRWRQYWQRSVRTGHAYAEIAARYWNSADPLWKRDALRNWVQGLFYLGLLPGSAGLAILTGSALPVAGAILFLPVLAAYTAFRFRHKSNSVWTLFCYGLHSHLQHLPMLLGQTKYWLGHWSRKDRNLIEYK